MPAPKRSSLPRTVKETERYEEHRQQIYKDTAVYDDVFRAVEWGLATAPEKFPLAPDTNIRIAQIEAIGDTPECAVFFTHTDTDVELLDIQVIG